MTTRPTRRTRAREPRPLLSTRTLLILTVAAATAGIAAAFPKAAVPLTLAATVVTLLAQIVRD
ncbi:hypothetical protein DZF91_17980 [Actinomadura logoneensis]|uniref:Uncharacterized protein n=1 Tax=Actinomadura logoneensis TaxID=2293572 RepID=A0A372JJR9_9ACTN|nr:hypothetical protein [Actinomadura logoneensis]RFU40273.1 hypothetical protein DZF91_17980 [Actinomadura logoneensis]